MKASELFRLFIWDWQSKNKNSRLFRNNSGVAWNIDKTGKKYPIRFGIPLNGGGTDYISFTGLTITSEMVGQKICRADFIELKTKKDTIKKNQKIWYELVKSLYGKIFIVKESKNEKGYEINEY